MRALVVVELWPRNPDSRRLRLAPFFGPRIGQNKVDTYRPGQALEQGVPTIFNTDQGAQFTADEFTSILEGAGIQISMDGRGRALDNVFVERLWRTVKYEHIYLNDYGYVPDLETGLHGYFQFYNHERPHQSLGYRTPAEVHYA